MDLKQIVMLALQLSILATVFGFGLKATSEDLLYLIRRPGLFLRSLLAVFVAMPLAALATDKILTLPLRLEVVLVALAISPVPPLLPQRETKAGGHASYALGLMATLALVSIVVVPVMLEILARVLSRPLAMAPVAVAAILVKSTLAPLATGVAVRALMPAIADRLENVVTRIAKVLFPLAVLPLFIAAAPAIWAVLGDGSMLALIVFVVVGLAIGHILGGPDPEHASVLALSTAVRHPATALAIATTNFSNEGFGALILLYVLVAAIAAIPYVALQRRRRARRAISLPRVA